MLPQNGLAQLISNQGDPLGFEKLHQAEQQRESYIGSSGESYVLSELSSRIQVFLPRHVD